MVLLLHDAELLGIVDDWVATVDESTFEDLLPLLRRTFSRFEVAERRQLGEPAPQPGRATGRRSVAAGRGARLGAGRAAPCAGWPSCSGWSVP